MIQIEIVLALLVLQIAFVLVSGLQLRSNNDGIEVIVFSNSEFISGNHYLEDVLEFPHHYSCILNLTSIKNLQKVTYIGYTYNKLETICDLRLRSGNSSQTDDSSVCQFEVDFDYSKSVEIRWNISRIDRRAGEHNVSCTAGVKTEESEGKGPAPVKNLRDTRSVRFFEIPQAINITIFPLPSVDFMFQDKIYYNFTCHAVGGYPPSRLQNQLIQDGSVLAEDIRGGAHSEFRFQLLMSSHSGAYLTCKDLTHGDKSKHLATNTKKIRKFAYIRRNDKKSGPVIVYKNVGEKRVKCSDYVSWSGTVEFFWFGRYGKSRNKFPDSTTNSYTIRYIHLPYTEAKGPSFMMCSVRLIDGATPIAIYVNFPIKFHLESPLSLWTTSILWSCAVLGAVVLVIGLLICIKRRSRRRKVNNKGMGGLKHLAAVQSSLANTKQSAKGHPLWRKSTVPRPFIKDSHGDVICLPYSKDEAGGGVDVLRDHQRQSSSKITNKRTEDIHRLSTALGPVQSKPKAQASSGESAMATWKRWTMLINKSEQQKPSHDQVLLGNRPRFIDLVRASIKVKDKLKAQDRLSRPSIKGSISHNIVQQPGRNVKSKLLSVPKNNVK